MSSKKDGSAKVPQIEIHEQQPTVPSTLPPTVILKDNIEKLNIKQSKRTKIQWIVLIVACIMVLTAIAISIAFISESHKYKVRIIGKRQFPIMDNTKTYLLQSTILDQNQGKDKEVNVTVKLDVLQTPKQGRLLTQASNQYQYSIFYHHNETGITVQIHKNGTTKFYVDVDSLAAFIEANYYQILTQSGTVSRSSLMEALYEIFHKQSSSSLSEDSSAQEESVFIDISVNDQGQITIIPKPQRNSPPSRRLQSKKQELQKQQPFLLRIVKSLLPTIKEKASSAIIPFLPIIGQKIEQLIPGIVGKVVSQLVQNIPTITNTVIQTCFPKGFKTISCKAKELMLALSGQSGGLESVIQLIKDKFFETLSEPGSSSANKKEKAIPVKAGIGMQGKVTSDDMANYIHFMGVGQL